MRVIANDIYGLDVYIIINLSKTLTKEKVKPIQSAMNGWCEVVSTGTYDGPLHSFSYPEYDEKHKCIFTDVDLGAMNPEKGFELLKQICEGCNKWIFGDEVISSIEITSVLEWEE